MSRNELTMSNRLGHSVLKIKNNLSYDYDVFAGHHVPMDARTSATEFKDRFTARVKLAREESKYTQNAIAELLGIKQDKYNKYEGRSLMPHKLIPAFCLACHISIDWLFTGRSPSSRRSTARAGLLINS